LDQIAELPKTEDGEKFLIEEFKALWDYYKRTQDERHKSLDYFFKAVALPATLVGALTATKFDWSPILSAKAGHQAAAAVLTVILLMGFSAFTAFVKEALNARSYEVALHAIRRHFEIRYGAISEAIVIHKLRSTRHSPGGSISRWQGLIFIFPNAAIGTAIVDLYGGTASPLVSGLAFVAFAVLQLVWEQFLRRELSRSHAPT